MSATSVICAAKPLRLRMERKSSSILPSLWFSTMATGWCWKMGAKSKSVLPAKRFMKSAAAMRSILLNLHGTLEIGTWLHRSNLIASSFCVTM
ncbi:hypothetical protein FQZ97_1234260 [compost metagenome]